MQLVDVEHYPAGVPQNRLSQVNREYDRAQAAFADGEAALAAGEYEQAIQDFRSAWQSLERAQAHAGR